MSYCKKCGSNLNDGDTFCSNCGTQINEQPKSNALLTVAKVFIIIGCVLTSLYGFIIPLAWCLPMTLKLCKKINNGENISTGFKVCTLLFVSAVGGILLLCDSQNN